MQCCKMILQLLPWFIWVFCFSIYNALMIASAYSATVWLRQLLSLRSDFIFKWRFCYYYKKIQASLVRLLTPLSLVFSLLRIIIWRQQLKWLALEGDLISTIWDMNNLIYPLCKLWILIYVNIWKLSFKLEFSAFKCGMCFCVSLVQNPSVCI